MDDLNRELHLVRTVLIAAIVVSVFHYVDNTLRYSDYVNGQSTPIARWMIPLGWVLLTAAGLMGYRCLTLGQRPMAAALLGVSQQAAWWVPFTTQPARRRTLTLSRTS